MTDDEIARIYVTSFEAAPGCARPAPTNLPPLIFTFARALLAAAPCQWPNCMSEKEQKDLADQIYRGLYGPTQGDLYAALRDMLWTDRKLAVIEVKDLPLGVQTYSGDMLDEAIAKHR